MPRQRVQDHELDTDDTESVSCACGEELVPVLILLHPEDAIDLGEQMAIVDLEQIIQEMDDGKSPAQYIGLKIAKSVVANEPDIATTVLARYVKNEVLRLRREARREADRKRREYERDEQAALRKEEQKEEQLEEHRKRRQGNVTTMPAHKLERDNNA